MRLDLPEIDIGDNVKVYTRFSRGKKRGSRYSAV
jgi:hypothetical protein